MNAIILSLIKFIICDQRFNDDEIPHTRLYRFWQDSQNKKAHRVEDFDSIGMGSSF